jgi:hypothetical protein
MSSNIQYLTSLRARVPPLIDSFIDHRKRFLQMERTGVPYYAMHMITEGRFSKRIVRPTCDTGSPKAYIARRPGVIWLCEGVSDGAAFRGVTIILSVTLRGAGLAFCCERGSRFRTLRQGDHTLHINAYT